MEMFRGVIDGLQLTEPERQLANQNIKYVRHNGLTGDDFLAKIAAPLLHARKYDILWLDPLNGFLGGDLFQR